MSEQSVDQVRRPGIRRLSTEGAALAAPDRVEGTNQPFNPNRDPRKNVEINLGKACNNRCVFCLDGMPKREDRSYLPWETLKVEMERWANSGHRYRDQCRWLRR